VIGGRDCPKSRSFASVAKDHPAHPITQPFDLFRVGGTPEALGEIEKLLLFTLFRFDHMDR
jgi:hypothetical protein